MPFRVMYGCSGLIGIPMDMAYEGNVWTYFPKKVLKFE